VPDGKAEYGLAHPHLASDVRDKALPTANAHLTLLPSGPL